MRLSDTKYIYFGKETGERYSRHDIIYHVFLGDREVWTKQDDEEEIALKLPYRENSIGLIWEVAVTTNNTNATLSLHKMTDATTIVGTVEWGDGTIEKWRSGQTMEHTYSSNGLYLMWLNREAALFDARIGRIEKRVDSAVKLVGVVLGGLKLRSKRYNDEDRPNDEDKRTIFQGSDVTNVYVPYGVTEIPDRLFYNCPLHSIVFGEGERETTSEESIVIGEEAFVASDSGEYTISEITMYNKFDTIKDRAIGYKINGGNIGKITNFTITCYGGSAAEAYADAEENKFHKEIIKVEQDNDTTD